MYKILMGLLVLVLVVPTANAVEVTAIGNIVFTQWHANPKCRTVQHKENATGNIRNFRIDDLSATTTADDISSVVLSALLANRDVAIAYNSAVTTGCGPEPRIVHITIY